VDPPASSVTAISTSRTPPVNTSFVDFSLRIESAPGNASTIVPGFLYFSVLRTFR